MASKDNDEVAEKAVSRGSSGGGRMRSYQEIIVATRHVGQAGTLDTSLVVWCCVSRSRSLWVDRFDDKPAEAEGGRRERSVVGERRLWDEFRTIVVTAATTEIWEGISGLEKLMMGTRQGGWRCVERRGGWSRLLDESRNRNVVAVGG